MKKYFFQHLDYQFLKSYNMRTIICVVLILVTIIGRAQNSKISIAVGLESMLNYHSNIVLDQPSHGRIIKYSLGNSTGIVLDLKFNQIGILSISSKLGYIIYNKFQYNQGVSAKIQEYYFDLPLIYRSYISYKNLYLNSGINLLIPLSTKYIEPNNLGTSNLNPYARLSGLLGFGWQKIISSSYYFRIDLIGQFYIYNNDKIAIYSESTHTDKFAVSLSLLKILSQ